MANKKDPDSTALQKGLRLFFTLMLSGRKMSATELAGELECSKQTVARLVDQVDASRGGIIQISYEGNRKYYRMKRPASRLPLPLGRERLAQLTLCYDFLAKLLPEGMKGSLADTIHNNLYQHLPEGECPPESIGLSLGKGMIDYRPFEGFLSALTQAIYECRACMVTYRKQINAEPRTFLYAPQGLMNYREAIYVTGWRLNELSRKPEREATLALQRLGAVELTEIRTAAIPKVNNLEDGTFGVMLRGPFKVVIKFAPETATYIAERIWSKDQAIQIHEDGSLTLQMTSRNAPETLSWVLGFGASAMIVSPQWLAQELLKALRSAVNLYEDS